MSLLELTPSLQTNLSPSKVPVWSTNITSTTTSSLEAILLDEGNLVLRELSGNSSTSLWESFDHPAHTWIPGMKMRLDKRTKVSQRLISWKNVEDPAPGLFSLELDPNGSNSYFILWNGSQSHRQQCEVYDYCGAFGRCSEQTQKSCDCLQGFQRKSEHDWSLQDYSGGCERKTQLQCQNNSAANGKSDKFLTNSNMALPENPQSVAVRSVDECETTCLNNCSCTAYAYEDSQCSIWSGNLLGVQQGASDGKTLYIKLAASEFSSPKKGGDVLSLLDPRLEGNADVEELSRICKVAGWCIQDDDTHRPTMGQVVQILEGILDVSRSPIPRTLQVFVDNPEQIIFFTESSSSQSSQSRTNTSTQAKSNTSSTNS
ncbi:hypothetical protein Pint_02130 [Pistacia integerrima]|uniref:Uncharacterized protein n=1 Tax=Pistacia integerrima TaxID=434235 RepID=A0ACC0ZJX2_9ROSI|nr:hypothetical protein Pint_02130 [Pistacia integerrima]